MPLNIEQYDRKPFRVEAVLVTEENIEQVAKWCRGEVRSDVQGDRTVKYVYVDVPNAKSERQKKSMIGEWVLRAGKSFKCYTTKAFDDCFEKPSDAKHPADQPFPGLAELADKYAPGRI